MNIQKTKLDAPASLTATTRTGVPRAVKCRQNVHPNLVELLRGVSFLGDDIQVDATAFVVATVMRLHPGNPVAGALTCALDRLLKDPTDAAGFIDAARSCEVVRTREDHGDLDFAEVATRCHFYCATLGQKEFAQNIAAFAVEAAYAPSLPQEAVRAQAQAAVAWLLVMTGQSSAPTGWTTAKARQFLSSAETKSVIARRMIERMVQSCLNFRSAAEIADSADYTVPVSSPTLTLSVPSEQSSFVSKLSGPSDYIGNGQIVCTSAAKTIHNGPKRASHTSRRAHLLH